MRAFLATLAGMCCLVTTLALLGPRAAIVVWWLIEPSRWSLAFSSFVIPLLGFLFLPWTTLAYVFVAPGGVVGGDWLLIAIGLLLDILQWSGGLFGNRGRLPTYAR